MSSVEQSSSVLAEALGSKPLWTQEVEGEVSYRIERFVCRGRNLRHSPLAQPVLITHFGGKKVSTRDTLERVTSFPSISTLVPAGIESSWAIQSALDFAAIYLRGDSLLQLQESCVDTVEPVALKSPLCNALSRELVELLGRSLGTEETDRPEPRHVQALSSAMLWQLCHELHRPTGQQSTASVTPRFNYVQEALRHIEANIEKPLTSGDIANQVGLHQSHFRKVFRDVTGVTLHRYILLQRLEKARGLLTHSGLGLSEIAAVVGFSSQSHMTTRFRKHFDVTPSAFRRLHLA